MALRTSDYLSLTGPGDRRFAPERRSVMKRFGVNKAHSAKKFRKQIGRTKLVNLKAAPMRGGIRL